MKRILVVPGDLLHAGLGASLLDRGSFRIRSAADERQAMAIATVWSPDLIVIGGHLSGVAAGSLCRQVRAAGFLSETKLLVATEHYGYTASVLELDLCDSHLVAPTDEELLTSIAHLLEVQRRGAPRAPLEALAQLSGFGLPGADLDIVLATVISVSVSGIRIESQHPLQLGARGQVVFVLPQTAHRLVAQCTVRVIADELQQHYGLVFEGLTPHQIKQIETFVSHRLGAGGS